MLFDSAAFDNKLLDCFFGLAVWSSVFTFNIFLKCSNVSMIEGNFIFTTIKLLLFIFFGKLEISLLENGLISLQTRIEKFPF